MKQVKDIGDLCTHCHRDTSFGSGLFVNRIPSGTETENGYLCPDCQMYECDRCDELIGCDEDIYLEVSHERVHPDCATKHELNEQDKIDNGEFTWDNESQTYMELK